MNCFVGQWKVLAGFLIYTFSVLGLRRIVGVPVTFRSRRVAGAPVSTFPFLRVHVLSTAEEGSEQRDLLRSAQLGPIQTWFRGSLCLLRGSFASNAMVGEQTS